MYSKLLIALFLVFSHTAHSKITSFTITPAVCVVQAGEVCSNGFVFNWQLETPMKACIVRARTEKILYCSKPSINHQIELPLELSESETFLLNAQTHNKQQQVLVKSVVIEVRQAKRHVWSVF